MSPDIFFGAGDTAPVVSDTLYNPDGTRLDLTGGSVVARFRDKDQIGNEVSEPVVIVQTTDATTFGNIEWTPAGARAEGNYNLQWIVTLPGGTVVTVPNDRYLWMQVWPAP
jgi:hypothetical protein